jgi:RNA polymerase sigma-70 factor (ECF subfamily)
VTDDDIRQFLDHDYERVVRVVAAVCGDRERAEDAVQECLVNVWSRRRKVDDLARWVTVAAVNRARSRWRTRSAEQRAFERLALLRWSGPSEEPAPLEARVVRALQSLPAQQRKVVALHYLMDLSVAEVASYLGLTDGTVKTHLYRGRVALRTALQEAPQKDGSHA